MLQSHRVAKSQTQLSDGTELRFYLDPGMDKSSSKLPKGDLLVLHHDMQLLETDQFFSYLRFHTH